MPRSRPIAGLAAALSVAAMVASGCSSLPDSGSVHRDRRATDTTTDNAAQFAPPQPAPGDSEREIVSGFMLAMTAVPLRMSAARTFVARGSAPGWHPERSTLVYDSWSLRRSDGQFRLRLSGVQRLDARGARTGAATARETRIDLDLAKDDGQWRILNPPDAILVPSWYFESQFVPLDLYFFDQTGRFLVPDRIYLPRGEQSASTLVRQLLRGPGARLRAVTHTGFPAGTQLDFSAQITADGTVEIPLSRQVGTMSAPALRRATAQLAWTLRQLPGVTRIRLTSDDAPLSAARGSSGVDVLSGARYAPWGAGASTALFGLDRGRVEADGARIAGPFGKPGFSLRSLGVALDGRSQTAVARDGRAVFVSRDGGPARRIYRGSDVLEPAVDMAGYSWLADRTGRGAQIVIARGARWRVVEVPGISGERIRRLLISRDGTRLVALLGRSGTARVPQIMVSEIVRSGHGSVRRLTPARPVSTGSRLPVVDIAWVSGNDLAVLTDGSASSQVSFTSLDGTSAGTPEPDIDQWRGRATALVGSPDDKTPLLLIGSTGRYYRLDHGHWVVAPVSRTVTAATYVG